MPARSHTRSQRNAQRRAMTRTLRRLRASSWQHHTATVLKRTGAPPRTPRSVRG